VLACVTHVDYSVTHMKDDHLTLRLPKDLARALARWARDRGLPKSHVVREAVAYYVASGRGAFILPDRPVTAAELAARWATLPRLDPEEAGRFGADVAAARGRLPRVRSRWG